ncbi:hypothetical protein, partial [Dysosmobacter sp.]|uniref:hypothetical protein n=1 Tax=Dysosmobacter sp. TaxID=2591382 RepID=UPI003AACF11E
MAVSIAWLTISPSFQTVSPSMLTVTSLSLSGLEELFWTENHLEQVVALTGLFSSVVSLVNVFLPEILIVQLTVRLVSLVESPFFILSGCLLFPVELT